MTTQPKCGPILAGHLWRLWRVMKGRSWGLTFHLTDSSLPPALMTEPSNSGWQNEILFVLMHSFLHFCPTVLYFFKFSFKALENNNGDFFKLEFDWQYASIKTEVQSNVPHSLNCCNKRLFSSGLFKIWNPIWPFLNCLSCPCIVLHFVTEFCRIWHITDPLGIQIKCIFLSQAIL